MVGTTAAVALTGSVGSFIVGLSDVAGFSNYVYGQLGGMIDNMAGYSVGNAFQSNMSDLYDLGEILVK